METSGQRSRWKFRVGRFITINGDLYAAAICLLLWAHVVIGERMEIVALANAFLHLLILPLFVWLVVSAFRRRWVFALMSAVPVSFFALTYGGNFLPRTLSAPSDATRISLLTYNLHSERVALVPMIEVIRTANADIVAIQEISDEAAALFEVEFAMLYPYRRFHPQGAEGPAGQGVMSKFPIITDEFWRNTHLPSYLGHQRTAIRIQTETVVVYNTHPMIPFRQDGKLFNAGLRWAEIDSVLERAAADTQRVILAGDFNMNDLAADYTRITAHYVDAYRAAGWGLGLTFPDFRAANASPFRVSLPLPPLVRIDHVFHTRDIMALEARVWPTSGGSDHHPVFVRLALLSG